MTFSAMLLKAPHVGVREFKSNLSKFIKTKSPFIVTDRGLPVEVMIPYPEIVEIAELMDEATDSGTLRAVQEGRSAIKNKTKGASVSMLFDKIKKKNK